MNKQIEERRKAITDRFAHAWNKSSTRYPIPLKEYRALLDLWEAAKEATEKALWLDERTLVPAMELTAREKVVKVLEKLEKGG